MLMGLGVGCGGATIPRLSEIVELNQSPLVHNAATSNISRLLEKVSEEVRLGIIQIKIRWSVKSSTNMSTVLPSGYIYFICNGRAIQQASTGWT
jgi:hypothetical protein